MGNRLGRGMGTVRCRKRVVDEDVAQPGQRPGHRRIVLFLARVEARVLEQQDVSGRHVRDGLLGLFPDAVGGEMNPAVEMRLQRLRDRRQREFRVRRALRAPEMRQQDHLGALVRQFDDRRRDAFDPCHVGDLAVLHRHVEIDPQEHALSREVVNIVEGPEAVHRIFPSFEKLPDHSDTGHAGKPLEP